MLSLALLLLLCLACQFIAWKFKFPAILLYSVAGLVLGGSHILNPVETLGENYHTLISFSVALILFEGGMHLKFKELSHSGKLLKRIFFINTPLCYLLTFLCAHYLAGLSIEVSLILASLYIITGPTVVMPLLRQAKITPKVGSALKWEGIVNDPVGALLTIITFEFIILSDVFGSHSILIAEFALIIIGVGLAAWGAAYLLKEAYTRGYVPEHLKRPLVIVSVTLLYAGANVLLDEAGLVAVTVFGCAIANMQFASNMDIKRFVDPIALMLISIIFVVISSTLDLRELLKLDTGSVLFLIALIFIIRPVSVLLSTFRAGTFRERLMLGWIAPRGIVCAVTAGFIGPKLVEAGHPDAAMIVPLTFAVIFMTVLLHGSTIRTLGRKLNLQAKDGGAILVGANPFTLELSRALRNQDIPVLLMDTSWYQLRTARMEDIPIYHGEILSEEVEYMVNMEEYSTLIVATHSAAYNSLVISDCAHDFGRHNMFQVQVATKEEQPKMRYDHSLKGNMLAESQSYGELMQKCRNGWKVKVKKVTDKYTIHDLLKDKEETVIPLMLLSSQNMPSPLPSDKNDIKDTRLLCLEHSTKATA